MGGEAHLFDDVSKCTATPPTLRALRLFLRSKRSSSVRSNHNYRRMRCIWLLLLCSLAPLSRASLPAVDDASFDALVASSPEAWVLEFSSPRCGTCQELAPLYAAVAARLGGAVRFGVVDIDTEGGMALARRLDVLEEGVPNVRAWARRDGPATGERAFAGWELPTEEQLLRRVVQALAPAVRAA